MFLRTFGPGSIDLLPPSIWDRLLVLRSAPGGGKTSLMRLFSSDSLTLIHEREDLRDLAEKMRGLGALTHSGPGWLGILLNLSRSYRGLADVVPTSESATRLFFRLLDARVMVATIRAALVAANRDFPSEAQLLRFDFTGRPDDTDLALRFGGLAGPEILRWARSVEGEMLGMLDSLVPVKWNDDRGHAEPYSLRFLSYTDVWVGDQPLATRPLVMLDDGHNLARPQRDALLMALGDRSLGLARWYSERYEALSSYEILTAIGKKGRDYELVELENIARGTIPDGERQRFRPGQFERVLTDIANRRAAPALKRHADVDADFAELIDPDEDDVMGSDRLNAVRQELSARLDRLRTPRYDSWVAEAAGRPGYFGLVRMREIEILVARDLDRRQGELFEATLTEADSRERSNSGLREAARLLLADEFELPFYFGHDAVAKLGSQNIEQYLVVCGDLFSEILARVTMDENPQLSALRQDRIIRRTSDLLWREIPRLARHGRDVQRLIEGIVAVAKNERRKPTVPYPPGVTGTAMLMSDRERLLQPDFRQATGSERLYDALAEAIANNLISAEPARSSKNQQVMVLYLNRLLCPRFGLVLGRGGFRERRIAVMANWITDTPSSDRFSTEYVTESLPL